MGVAHGIAANQRLYSLLAVVDLALLCYCQLNAAGSKDPFEQHVALLLLSLDSISYMI
jgi:hypothetical protein